MRTRGLNKLALSAGLISFLSGTSIALADVPAALDRVPANAQIVVAVRDLDALRTKVTGMITAVGAPMPDEAKMGMEAFMGTAGLNQKGSLAVVVTIPEQGMGSEEPDMVLLMPVSDSAAFIKAWGGTGDKISEVKMFGQEHESGFAKDIGNGYVAIGKTKEGVEKFEGKAGSKAAHTKALGTMGNRVSDNADVVLIANFPQMKTHIENGVREMKDSMEGMAAMMPDGGAQLGSIMKLVTGVADSVVKDGETGIIGLGIDAKGVNFDVAANFREGTESAKQFAAEGKASGMTAALPAGDFLFAGSFDWSSPGVRTMVKTMNEATQDGSPFSKLNSIAAWVENADGYSYYFGAADLGNGLFSNSAVTLASKDPAKVLASWKSSLTDVNGKTQDGMTLKTEYKENAKTIGGLQASSYGMSFEVDPNNEAAGPMQMVMPMLFGPEGKMSGYVATTDKMMVMTLGKNSALLESVLNSAKSGKGFATNALVQQTAERLPADRVMDAYIGVKSVMDMAQGAMAMFGAPAEFEVPAQIAPIGMSASMNKGGMHYRMHVPTDVIKSIFDVTKQFQGGGDEEMGDEPMEGGNEKPRF
jgi:hypothetical protein